MAAPTPAPRRASGSGETDKLIALLVEGRNRYVAASMGAAERATWWKKLSPVEQKDLREKVVGSFDRFYDLVRDVIKVDRRGVIRNEDAVDLIAMLHEQMAKVTEQYGRVENLLEDLSEE